MYYKSVLTIFVFHLFVVNAGQKCDELECSKVKCLHSYNPFNCSNSTDVKAVYNREGALCGCCPGCVKYKVKDEVCSANGTDPEKIDLTRYFTPIKSIPGTTAPITETDECASGLRCTNAKCVYSNPALSDCTKDEKWAQRNWRPTCDLDGSYAAVQCKTNGPGPRCFCYARNGARIFGWDWFDNRKDMKCVCSRLVHQLKSLDKSDPRTSLVFHCTENGNFDPLQCNNGLCYCVDEFSGQPNSTFVHESLWKTLPCYRSSMGEKHLRLCDSQAVAAKKMMTELRQHGATVTLQTPPCDPDGSYAAVQCDIGGPECNCRTKNNVNIASYRGIKGQSMNCNCARDKVIFMEKGIPHQLDCEGYGDYKQLQNPSGSKNCTVDSDGFFIEECD